MTAQASRKTYVRSVIGTDKISVAKHTQYDNTTRHVRYPLFHNYIYRNNYYSQSMLCEVAHTGTI
jgi:hypothetical protein